MKTGTLRKSADNYHEIELWTRFLDSVARLRIRPPEAAFGNRLLRSAHNGPVVRIRRGFDNQEADVDGFGYIIGTGMRATEWSEGEGFISVHYDQSGNGNHINYRYAAAQIEYHEP